MTNKTLEALNQFNSAEGIFAVDTERKFSFWSKSAERMLGYTSKEVIGKSCYQILCSTQHVSGVCSRSCAPVENSIRNRTTNTFDAFWVTKDNILKRYSVSTLFTNGGKHHSETVHVFRDVSKEVQFKDYPEVFIETTEEWAKPKQLTKREDQALRMLAAGLGTDEIAELMGIKKITARNHILRVMDRLNAKNRLEAVVIGTRLRII